MSQQNVLRIVHQPFPHRCAGFRARAQLPARWNLARTLVGAAAESPHTGAGGWGVIPAELQGLGRGNRAVPNWLAHMVPNKAARLAFALLFQAFPNVRFT